MKTKSTRHPKYDALHFALALMKAEDAWSIFTLEDQAILGKAKAIKTYTVYIDIKELGDTFNGIKALAETGTLRTTAAGKHRLVKMDKRRKTMAKRGPTQDEEAEIDGDDQFHEHFKAFVERHGPEVQALIVSVLGTMDKYREMANFFEDAQTVWPPPRDE